MSIKIRGYQGNMIIQSQNVMDLLQKLLRPVSIDCVSFQSKPLQSAALLSKLNGSVLSFSTSAPTTEIHSINNLKMMSLLIRDKWAEDELVKQEQVDTTNGHATWPPSNIKNCYQYETPSTEGGEPLTTNIYTYEIEELHACVCQLPRSDLLLLFIAEASFPFGLLALKMQKAVTPFQGLHGYQLG